MFIRDLLIVGVITILLCILVVPADTADFSLGFYHEKLVKGCNTLYVGGDGPNNYTRIQDAINDAKDGDTVFVYDDSSPYYEYDITVNKSIRIIGENAQTTVIDGCQLSNVFLVTAPYVTIAHLTIKNASPWGKGIAVMSAHNTIADCIVYRNGIGIFLDDADNNAIYNCNISRSWCRGIGLSLSSSNIISNCTIFLHTGESLFGGEGIRLSESHNNVISHCHLHQNWAGIWIVWSHNNTLSHNMFKEDGIGLLGKNMSHFIHIIVNNTVNGKPLRYFLNESNFTLNGIDAGQVILVGCTNFTVEHLNIGDTIFGIETAYTTGSTISNCNISTSLRGIACYYSDNNHISECQFWQNYDGIRFFYSPENAVSNCSLRNYWVNVLVDESSNTSIRDCTISQALDGIHVWFSNHIIVSRCEICHNHEYGIRLYSSSYTMISDCSVYNNEDGLIIRDGSDDNMITNCTIEDNEERGIFILYASNNSIQRCNISSNKECGIWIEYRAHMNVISHNNFISNGHNAYFEWAAFTTWDNNYWDDWIGIGPKIIKGKLVWDFIIYLPIPWFNFDWHPAEEPYEWWSE